MGAIGIGDVLYGNNVIGKVPANNGIHTIDQLIVIFLAAMILIPIYVGNSIKDHMEMRIGRIFMLRYDNLINSPDKLAYILCDCGEKAGVVRRERQNKMM